MTKIFYTQDHEWIRLEGDVGTVGISNYAQEQLGDIVFVELPQPGTKTGRGDEIAVVESVKAASEIYAPVSGEVIEANSTLEGAPVTVNEAAESDGWFFKIRISDQAELAGLMDAAAYQAFVEGLA
ncbi:MAG: glycine cleavage system protein GcvH [Alphaproteobacteria bacterium]|nr:glycine cleavage system protein GcvH [Alphaproteobacteria bacterium]